MSSSSADNDSGAEDDTINRNGRSTDSQSPTPRAIDGITNGTRQIGGRILELLEEEREDAPTPAPLGNGVNRYKKIPRIDDLSEDGLPDALSARPESPVDSIPDDSPSVQVRSIHGLLPGSTDIPCRALSYLLPVVVAYCLQWLPGRVSTALLHLSDRSIDDSNRDSQALHSLYPALRPHF